MEQSNSDRNIRQCLVTDLTPERAQHLVRAGFGYVTGGCYYPHDKNARAAMRRARKARGKPLCLVHGLTAGTSTGYTMGAAT